MNAALAINPIARWADMMADSRNIMKSGPAIKAAVESLTAASAALRGEIEIMLFELESSQLEVQLVPQRIFTNEGGCVRVAVSKNATWYREFCAKFPSGRKKHRANFDTRIKRKHIVRVLQRLLASDHRSIYAPPLAQIAHARLGGGNRGGLSARAATLRLYPVAACQR